MIFREYGQTGKSVSVISCGGMRLPNPQNPEEGIAILHAARRAGITYFDTAPFYCDDQSETIYGAALRTMPPSPLPLYTSSKCAASDGSDFRRGLERSLERLGVPQIDFFHIWCVMDPADWQRRIAGGALNAALRAKSEGLIAHVCVSSHMTGTEIEKMLADHPEIEGVTLGYCAINFPYRRQAVLAAHQRARGVVAMNPLGGGLIPQNPETFDFIRGPGDPDVVTAAIRFLASDPAITTALIGFNSIAEVESSARAVENMPERPPEQMEQLRQRIEKDFNEMCTGCGYCLPCPLNIPIPQFMDIHNLLQLKVPHKEIFERFKYHWGLTPEQAGACISCGQCEARCTQHLPIIERLQTLQSLKIQ